MPKILVPVDGSEYSKKALEQTLLIAKGTGAGVTVVHVIETLPTVYIESQKVLNKAKTKYRSESVKLLDEYKNLAEKLGFHIETVMIEGTDPAESIVAFSEKGRFDMIAMGNRGHGKLKEIVLGSTSNKVLHHAKCSVLIVK